MNDLYKPGECCLQFSYEEIVEYLVQPLKGKCKTVLQVKTDVFTEESAVNCVFLGEQDWNFYISFHGKQVCIFITDEAGVYPGKTHTFKKEFLFIDDAAKLYYTPPTTPNVERIIYEGVLRDKTHAEIFALLCSIIIVLNAAEKIEVDETVLSPIIRENPMHWYAKCKYIVKIANNSGKQKTIVFDNITFIVNGGK